MSNEPTFQELMAEFSNEIFVGRAEQLALFDRALTAKRPPFLILAISGQGGVGKSTLLEQFQHQAVEQDAVTALVNEDDLTIPAVLERFASQLAGAGYECTSFKQQYEKYQSLREEIEADPNAPRGMFDFVLRSSTKIVMKSLKRVPMAGEAAEVLLTPEAEETAADQVSAAYSYLAQKFKKEDDRRLLSATNQELTRYFLDDINRVAQNNRVVLCFDTYEQTSIFLDDWLRDLISAKFGNFSGRVMLVIAGRHPLGQPWTRFKPAINFVELEPFTETEARKYLSDCNIVEEDQVKELIRLSEGLPVLLALLTSTPGGLSTEVCESAVQRFLQDVLPEQREAALRACIPRYYNQDILGVILEPTQAKAAFEWLTQTPFAKSKALGWTYHDRVRSLMQRYLSLRSPREWSNLHTKLADYHHQELQQHHST